MKSYSVLPPYFPKLNISPNQHDHFANLPNFMLKVQEQVSKLNIVSQLLNKCPYTKLVLHDNETIVYSTLPSHAQYKPYHVDWTYTCQDLSVIGIINILEQQITDYLVVIPKCIQYVVSEPMIVYKKVALSSLTVYTPIVIELEIPPSATVNETIIGPDFGKCRSSTAITRYPQIAPDYSLVSLHDLNYVYPNGPGVNIYPSEPFDTKLESCANGIHFFKTYDEAVDYGG